MSSNGSVSLYGVGVGTVASSSLGTTPISTNRAPTSSDTHGSFGLFKVGQIWIDSSTGNSYLLTSFSASNALIVAEWSPLGQTGGNLNTLTGNTGGAVSPNSGNINVVTSGNLYTFSGSPHTLTISPTVSGYPTTPFVVGPSGSAGYQTIQSAIDAAHSVGGGTIAIQRGTYTEDLILRPYCSLYCATGNCDPNDVAIIGTHTPPVELSVISFGLLNFYSDSGAIFSSTEAGQCYLISFTCNWVLTQPGWVFDMPNWTGPLSPLMPVGTPGVAVDNCGDLSTADSGFLNNPNGGMTLNIIDSYIGSQQGALGTKTLITSGIAQFSLCDIFCPVNVTGNFQTGANANFFETSDFHQATIQFSGDSTGYLAAVNFDGLTFPAITMSSSGDWYIGTTNIDTDSSPAIDGDGSGILNLSGVSFSRDSLIADTVNLGTSSSFVVGTVRVNGDSPGQMGFTSITGTNSVTISTGTGTVKMSSSNSATNSAWIKIYIGTTAYWIPAWTTNAP